MIRSKSLIFSENSSRVGKAISDSWLIGVPSCFSGGRRMVKCTRSTAASDFSRLRQVRSPACGSPETSSTRRFSRTPSAAMTARLLAGVSSPGAGSELDLEMLVPGVRERASSIFDALSISAVQRLVGLAFAADLQRDAVVRRPFLPVSRTAISISRDCPTMP